MILLATNIVNSHLKDGEKNLMWQIYGETYTICIKILSDTVESGQMFSAE